MKLLLAAVAAAAAADAVLQREESAGSCEAHCAAAKRSTPAAADVV
jgi:hypothetical protein